MVKHPFIVFLSGPVSGLPDNNRAAFSDAADRIAAQTGVRGNIYVPTESVSANTTHEEAMSECLLELVGGQFQDWNLHAPYECLAQLPGWSDSPGALIEAAVALSIGVPVMSLDELLQSYETADA
ncbi:MAG: DUF4406 domain-containing protein [Gordonibacter sp.]|uniref:DUF4406 domain-containing protein n=1 Tax=Gordonibacter sp. TaxID=1968902 RepID=UPI002FCBCA3E